jgi:hypothetical protein
MSGQRPKSDLLGGRRAAVPVGVQLVMSSDDHATDTNWMAPGSAEAGQIDHLHRCIRSVQRQSPLESVPRKLPIRVTLDPFYCTLAIEACCKRRTS